MSRITLAFSCFFRLLFGGKLPARAADYLPEEAIAGLLPAAEAPKKGKGATASDKSGDKSGDKAGGKDAKDTKAKSADADAKVAKPKPKKPEDLSKHHADGALALLGLLQREGRLIDFLGEAIDDYDDADIGAAVRDIHRGCKKVLDDHLTLEAVMPGEEDDDVSVPKGFDPSEVRLIGEVSGDPPFKGTLRHKGLRATKVSLPKLSAGVDRHVVAPAEVEL